MKSIPAVILGSAFNNVMKEEFNLVEEIIETKWGNQIVFSSTLSPERKIYIIHRHGVPHKLLPNQINYRAEIEALKILGCNSLLVTSSVGVINHDLPLFTPLLLSDIIMLDNRLPDGSTCTMFTEPSDDQGHLVLNEGLFSKELSKQITEFSENIVGDKNIVFSYIGGPRTKTSAENSFLHKMGVDVNSMSLSPEIILANEYKISCCGLVVGHKYSGLSKKNTNDKNNLSLTLENSKKNMENLIVNFLRNIKIVKFKNMIYCFNE